VASGSSHDSINRLPEDDESAYASIVNFDELYENGYTVSSFVCNFYCISSTHKKLVIVLRCNFNNHRLLLLFFHEFVILVIVII